MRTMTILKLITGGPGVALGISSTGQEHVGRLFTV